MNRTKSMCMVMVMLLVGVGTGQEAPKQWVLSSCLVKVPQDHDQMAIIGSLAGTADVAGKAAQEVLGLTVAPAVGSNTVSPGVVQLLAQLPPEAFSKASAFWKAVGGGLRKGMEQLYEEEINQLRVKIDQAERQKAEALAKLQGQPLIEGMPSPEELAARKQELSKGQDTIVMELAAHQARRQAIEKQIAELDRRIDERIAGDQLLRDLQQLVEVQAEVERNTKRLVEGGRAEAQQAGEAFERVVKAKVELARQKEAVAQSAGGELLAKFHSELSEMSVRQAEMEARLGVALDQLRKAEAQLAQAVALMPQRIERDLAMRSLKETEERIYSIRQKLADLQPPTITIIGGGD